VKTTPQSAKDAQPRAQEADRILIMPVQQIVDPRNGGQTIAEIVGTGEVDDRVAINAQPENRAGEISGRI
jgi:hypothetical protein